MSLISTLNYGRHIFVLLYICPMRWPPENNPDPRWSIRRPCKLTNPSVQLQPVALGRGGPRKSDAIIDRSAKGTAIVASGCFWPRPCEKSCINSQIDVAKKITPFFLSLSEVAVVALILFVRFLAKYIVASAQADAPTMKKSILSACLQLFHDLRHAENVDCAPEIVSKHM